MRSFASAVGLLLLASAAASAQTPPPRFEIGLGTNPPPPIYEPSPAVFNASVTTVGLYADVRIHERWHVSPYVSSLLTSDRGFEGILLRTGLRHRFHAIGVATPYALTSVTSVVRRDRTVLDDPFQVAVGAGAGVRLAPALPVAVSLEARYDRWIEAGRNQVGLGLRVGVPFGGR